MIAHLQEDNLLEILEKIQEDESKLSDGQLVSDMALKIPRINSGEDKRTGMGRKLARHLFPTTEENRVTSYIAYGRLLGKLRNAYKSQITDINDENQANNPYQQARMFGNRPIFEQLLDEPLSEAIANPTPMPVEIAPYEELEPFLTDISQGKPANQPCQAFIRGAYYDDGRVDMCKQVVGDRYIGDLVDSVRNNSHVEHFLLGNNIVGDQGAEKIASLMENDQISPIKTYYLAGNCFTAQGASLLANALSTNTQVESLWLKRNPLKVEGVAEIARMLETNQSIKILDLVNVGMLDEGVKILFESLRQNHSLESLYIDANGITEEGANYIADYFEWLKAEKRKGLTSLFMAVNRLGNEGAAKIANAIAGYPYLTCLDLSSNRIQNDGLKVLLDKCQALPNLRYLGIGLYKSTSDMGELPNYFDGIGADLIADFIANNKTVQILGLRDTNIRDGGFEIIAKALESNVSLMELEYHQFRYFIPETILSQIETFLTRNIQQQLGVSMAEFRHTIKREIKHTNQIRFIDSIYRNNM